VPENEALTMETKLRQLTVDERRLNAYEVDKNRGRPAVDAVRDIRRRV
jgi:hypothetical protein